jgi:hypothetical protein
MPRLFSILIILLIGSPAASSWGPGAHIAHPSTLSKDLSNVKRIWYLPENPGETGNVWGIQSRDQHMKRMPEGPLAPPQRATDTYPELRNAELGPPEEEECDDHYYDGMSEDVYCWII